MVYLALLPLMRTPRLPVVDWTDGPRRFKWTLPFRRKTKFGFCACAITFQTQSTCIVHKNYLTICLALLGLVQLLIALRTSVHCELGFYSVDSTWSVFTCRLWILRIEYWWGWVATGSGRFTPYIGKVKAIPLQAWTCPKGSRRLRLPDFKTIGTWRW